MQEILQRYKELQDIIAILGMDELSDDDKVRRAARAQDQRFLSPAVHRGRAVHRQPGKYVKLEDTIRGFKEIVRASATTCPEQAFFMVGGIEEAAEKAKTLAGAEA